MFDATRIVRYGYLPKELPPCFTTNDLADHLPTVLTALSCTNPKCSIPLTYSGFKSEISRRRFAIPNPFHFCKTVDVIVRREAEIKPIFEKSKNSLRAPIDKVPQDGNAYAVRSSSTAETREAVEKLYQNNRFELLLDISSFFGSIYTHSIPWAIHGIERSKKIRDVSLVGNELDSCMQRMNYQQTNGILIGNDISRIVSEIILCSVDEQIQQAFPRVDFCRFVDDYYFFTAEPSEIQQIIAFVRSALAVYQLNLNENKVQVNESPFLYGKSWYVDMMQAVKLQTSDFLSWMINKYCQTKDPALLKYGLKVIDARRFTSDGHWQTMQSRILNIWVRYPFLAEQILPFLWKNKKQIKKLALKSAVISVIDQSILLQQDLELIWAVWFIKVFDVQISQQTAVKILKSGNDLAIIILLDILACRAMNSKICIQKELKSICLELKTADFDGEGNPGKLAYSARWMLSYEAEREKRFAAVGETFDIMSRDPFFKKLLRCNIKLYDSSFMYLENHFENRTNRKHNAKIDIKRLEEYLKSPEFQKDNDQDNQELSERFMRIIEGSMIDY